MVLCHVPGSLLSAVDTSVKKKKNSPCLHGTHRQVQKTENKMGNYVDEMYQLSIST